jgi:flagellar M-ring protein FliF
MQERPAKASVVLKLRHRSLADGEPEAIRNLVASAVDGLTPDRVVLVDAAGHLPLGPKTAERCVERRAGAGREADRHPRAGDRRGQRARLGDPGLRSGGHRGDPGNYDPDQTVTLVDAAHRADLGAPAGGRRSSRHGLECAQLAGLAGLSAADTPPQTAKSESGTYGASKTVRHVVEGPGGCGG